MVSMPVQFAFDNFPSKHPVIQKMGGLSPLLDTFKALWHLALDLEWIARRAIEYIIFPSNFLQDISFILVQKTIEINQLIKNSTSAFIFNLFEEFLV